jgi:hypothetical protein
VSLPVITGLPANVARQGNLDQSLDGLANSRRRD